jgi:hypothetical protein
VVEPLRNIRPRPKHSRAPPRLVCDHAPHWRRQTMVLLPRAHGGNPVLAALRPACATVIRPADDGQPCRRDDAALPHRLSQGLHQQILRPGVPRRGPH